MPGVAADHLQHHHPVVAGGGDVQAIDRLGGDGHSRREADGELGMPQIVVDGLGDADQPHAADLGQPAHKGKAAVAADGDQPVEAQQPIALADLGRAVVPAPVLARIGERIAAVGGAQDGPALVQDALHAVRRQLGGCHRPLHHPEGRLVDAGYRETVAAHRPQHHRADHGVQAGAVTAAGQDA